MHKLTEEQVREICDTWQDRTLMDMCSAYKVSYYYLKQIIRDCMDKEAERLQLEREQAEALSEVYIGVLYENDRYRPENLTGEEKYILKNGPKHSLRNRKEQP